jgi:hypothetical protein
VAAPLPESSRAIHVTKGQHVSDFYKALRNDIDVPIAGKVVGAFARLADEKDPDHNHGVTAATLIGDVLAEYLRKPVIDSELDRLRAKDEADELQRLVEQEERNRAVA